MEIFLTIISGVLVFILSQYILEFILKPLIKYKQVIAKIDNKLKFYANIITNPPLSSGSSDDYIIAQDDYTIAKKEIRDLSCDLESTYKSLLIFKPNKKTIAKVVKDLIWLSNVIGQRYKNINLPIKAAEKIDDIRKSLNIEEL